nr:thiamine pyrophosphate-binding protein [Nocardiopsis sp. CNR-923]
MTEQMTGAQSLIRSLEHAGVDTVFGIPGGAILPAYDPLYDSAKVRHILMRHEQGAGHAAEATPTPRVAPGCAWRPAAPEPPTSSPPSPTRTWTRSPWSRSPVRWPPR